jgi:hypothetical protein
VKRVRKLGARLTYANVVATLALFLALGGASYAALKLPAGSVGSKQLKSNAVTSAKVKDGSLVAKDFNGRKLPAGPTGPPGPPGGTGPTGQPGVAGATGVVETDAWTGNIPSTSTFSSFTFLGPTTTATTTSSQRLTGVAMVPIGNGSAGQDAYLDLCYQPSSGGTIQNFAGASPSVTSISTARISHVAAGSVVPGAGSWKVGACWAEIGTTPATANSNGAVNGWVQVTN